VIISNLGFISHPSDINASVTDDEQRDRRTDGRTTTVPKARLLLKYGRQKLVTLFQMNMKLI